MKTSTQFGAWFIVSCVVLYSNAHAAGQNSQRLQQEISILQKRIAKLEAQTSEQAIQQNNARLVRQVISRLDQEISVSSNSNITAGYDRGFFVKSPDDQFRLQINALGQIRYLFSRVNDGSGDIDKEGIEHRGANVTDTDASAFEIDRVQLLLHGDVRENLRYHILLESSDTYNNGTVRIREYELACSFVGEFGIKIGRFKEPFGAQGRRPDEYTLAIDRAVATEVFTLGRGTGVETFGVFGESSTRACYRVGIFNDFDDEGAGPFEDNDNSPSFAGRLGVLLNSATEEDFINESDLEFHEKAVAQFGVSYGFANDVNETNASGGKSSNYRVLARTRETLLPIPLFLGGTCNVFGMDVAYKHQGFSFLMEAFFQHIHFNDDFTYTHEFGSQRDALGILKNRNNNEGWFAQAGYFIVPKTFELFGRVGAIYVQDNKNDCYEGTFGWNWYVSGEDLKLSMDVVLLDDLPIVDPEANYDGIEKQALTMIRSQLQFKF